MVKFVKNSNCRMTDLSNGSAITTVNSRRVTEIGKTSSSASSWLSSSDRASGSESAIRSLDATLCFVLSDKNAASSFSSSKPVETTPLAKAAPVDPVDLDMIVKSCSVRKPSFTSRLPNPETPIHFSIITGRCG